MSPRPVRVVAIALAAVALGYGSSWVLAPGSAGDGAWVTTKAEPRGAVLGAQVESSLSDALEQANAKRDARARARARAREAAARRARRDRERAAARARQARPAPASAVETVATPAPVPAAPVRRPTQPRRSTTRRTQSRPRPAPERTFDDSG